jgi:tyrosyl-tRNA synthetase
MLTHEQVIENAETYLAQFFKIVDRDRAEVRWQSDWFGPFTLTDVIKLTSKFTVAQFLQRDDFASRFTANQPIAITELLYPLLQAYDSVEIKSDVEFGGTDQMFNLLVGRDLQQMMGQRPQQCFLVPLLPGTDGVQKMSKSLGNYIGIDEPPNDIYGKTMSLPDTMIVPYFDNLTDVTDDELQEIRHAIDNQVGNPMELKKRLAYELVAQFHDAEAARASQSFFERTVQDRERPDTIPTFRLPPASDLKGKRLSDIIVQAELAPSSAQAKRLIDQGGVRLDDRQITANVGADTLQDGVLQVGRRRMVRLVSADS